MSRRSVHMNYSAEPRAIPDLLRRLDDLFREEFTLQVPSADTDLLGTGLLDSLAFIDLLVISSDDSRYRFLWSLWTWTTSVR